MLNGLCVSTVRIQGPGARDRHLTVVTSGREYHSGEDSKRKSAWGR